MTVPAPRVIEGSQTQIGVPRPQPTPRAGSHPVPSPTAAPPTPAPTAVPTALPAAQPTPRAADWNDPERARQRLSHWLSRPAEERAHAALNVSKWANKIAAEYPDNPNVKQMKHDLPALFRAETIGALDNKQPFLANLFYRAYLTLDFVPPDPDLARRMKAAAGQFKRQGR